MQISWLIRTLSVAVALCLIAASGARAFIVTDLRPYVGPWEESDIYDPAFTIYSSDYLQIPITQPSNGTSATDIGSLVLDISTLAYRRNVASLEITRFKLGGYEQGGFLIGAVYYFSTIRSAAAPAWLLSNGTYNNGGYVLTVSGTPGAVPDYTPVVEYLAGPAGPGGGPGPGDGGPTGPGDGGPTGPGGVTPVPEPTTWATLIVGLAVSGLVMRRRRAALA